MRSAISGQILGSPEQRAKAAETRRARAALLRRDFLEATDWAEMAKARGIRLPAWDIPVTPAAMRRWLVVLGMSEQEYRAYLGPLRGPLDFHRLAPDWPLRAWVGLLLEYLNLHGNGKGRRVRE